MSLFKKYSILVIALGLLIGLAACGGRDKVSVNNTNNEETTKAKRYIIATDKIFAPFEFRNTEGDFVGIDVDLLAAIAEDQGFTYEIKPLIFSEALEALEEGQVDSVIAGLSITEERKQVFDFSDPYFDSGIVMGVAASNNEIKDYHDLANKNVAVVDGTEGAALAESIKDEYGFFIVPFEDSVSMYKDVMLGNSVALFEDYPVLGYAISQGVELKIASEMVRGSSYGFAVAKGKNPELLEMLNKGLANVKKNGKYQKILNTYIQN
ncbi:transporter substrate-binding domain-containing protein [Anaerotignum sp. MB30-C6]|uniref:transporter substrate-binding domain-containing protein n=1 Tax=Anaerotignum sp. MB30-C6 TaxID=3070814 RepID=UPI0027DAC259|nr:transporter substrate-binding domain-containing protein [Anaerotignum sp. MB30-C6]WMI81683.1 transporter substrate-binding domain-containing protein [Anaerotignum sp. MB30-C6]